MVRDTDTLPVLTEFRFLGNLPQRPTKAFTEEYRSVSCAPSS